MPKQLRLQNYQAGTKPKTKIMETETNIEMIGQKDADKGSVICSLFEKVKEISGSGDLGRESEQRLIDIQRKFETLKKGEGAIFCSKAMAILYEKRGDEAKEIEWAIKYYEQAHDLINDAVVKARQIKWVQPSLLKRQGAIKSKLGEALHKSGDHHNANLLEKTAFKVFGDLLQDYPDYGEGHFTAVSASFKKVKWMLRKMLFDLGKTEELLKNPRHTKHKTEGKELHDYYNDIERMRSTIIALLPLTN